MRPPFEKSTTATISSKRSESCESCLPHLVIHSPPSFHPARKNLNVKTHRTPPHLSPPASERRPTEAAKRPRRRTAHRSPLPGRQRLLRRASGRRDLEREARGGPMGAPSRPLGPWLVGVCDRRIAVAQRCGETKNKVCWIIGSFVTLFRCIDA